MSTYLVLLSLTNVCLLLPFGICLSYMCMFWHVSIHIYPGQTLAGLLGLIRGYEKIESLDDKCPYVRSYPQRLCIRHSHLFPYIYIYLYILRHSPISIYFIHAFTCLYDVRVYPHIHIQIHILAHTYFPRDSTRPGTPTILCQTVCTYMHSFMCMLFLPVQVHQRPCRFGCEWQSGGGLQGLGRTEKGQVGQIEIHDMLG